jgi:phospholipid/cholesterol/gamma-HCH transport system substrate-binding protein
MNLHRYLDRESSSALAKTVVFLVLTGGATFLLMNILANGLFRPLTTYKAEFTDVTNVAKGDDVRIAGVPVGQVKKIEIVGDRTALVTFGVDPDVPLTTNTQMTIRYRNLVGQRYFALSQGDGGPAARLKEGATIGLDHTQEALDLTVLFQGFKPVFQALSPTDTNKLAFEIVKTLQGESGTVQNLLATTGSLTQTLADHDQLIGDVIDNLSETLQIVANRDAELGDTIDSLQRFVHGLNGDRDAIFSAVDSVSALSVQLGDLLRNSRVQTAKDIAELRAATAAYSTDAHLAGLQQDLQILPYKMRKLTQVASGASQFNFYICALNGSLDLGLPGIESLPLTLDGLGGDRCVDRGVQ